MRSRSASPPAGQPEHAGGKSASRFDRDRLSAEAQRFVDIGDIRTRLYEDGAGDPIVLIHGGRFGSFYSLDSWSLNLPILARRFRVVAYDRPGQGHTSAPPTDEQYVLPTLVEHAIAVVELVADGPVHLVGHSAGAFLATSIALKRPDLVRTLVIVDSNTTAPDDPRFPRTAFYDALERKGTAGMTTRQVARREIDAQSYSSVHVTGDLVDRLERIANLRSHRIAATKDRQLYGSTYSPSLAVAREQVLAAIDATGVSVPTTIMWGADDVSAPLPLALALFQRLARHGDHTELHILARAGHYCFREQPDAFEREIVGWCSAWS